MQHSGRHPSSDDHEQGKADVARKKTMEESFRDGHSGARIVEILIKKGGTLHSNASPKEAIHTPMAVYECVCCVYMTCDARFAG